MTIQTIEIRQEEDGDWVFGTDGEDQIFGHGFDEVVEGVVEHMKMLWGKDVVFNIIFQVRGSDYG